MKESKEIGRWKDILNPAAECNYEIKKAIFCTYLLFDPRK